MDHKLPSFTPGTTAKTLWVPVHSTDTGTLAEYTREKNVCTFELPPIPGVRECTPDTEEAELEDKKYARVVKRMGCVLDLLNIQLRDHMEQIEPMQRDDRRRFKSETESLKHRLLDLEVIERLWAYHVEHLHD